MDQYTMWQTMDNMGHYFPGPLLQDGERMSKSKRNSGSAARAFLAASVLSVVPGWVSAGQPGLDPGAVELLRKSTSFVGGLQQFSLEAHSSIELVLLTGQKIQFDSASAGIIQRPDKMYAVRLGEVEDQEFFYNGKTLTLHQLDAGFYATVEVPDTLEGMLDFARDSLDIVAPAGDFLYANAFEILMDGVTSAFVVGPSFVEGVMCDHLAFSKPGTDFQVWIQQGEQPLPRRIVITSRDVVSAPQFTVQIRDWNLAPGVSADRFNFIQPDEAQAIDFILLGADGN
jgi:hypothetical protein